MDNLSQLKLLQLADSALPIGSAAHSWGLETLTSEGILTVQSLPAFLESYMQESGLVDSVFYRAAYGLGQLTISDFNPQWQQLNQRLSAIKLARESREASAVLGRRFLQLVNALADYPVIAAALETAQHDQFETHYCTAFGLVASQLGVEPDEALLFYLHQNLNGLISACQRLLPLGQSRASQLLWQLKPYLLEIAIRSASRGLEPTTVNCFIPMLEIAGMRHVNLNTRLFIS